MRYMMLIYSQENEAATPEEMGVVAATHKAVMDEARDRGVFRAADPLETSSTATTVRIQNGRVLVTDGPFAETKEQLAGYYILDCQGSRRSSWLGGKNSHRVRRRNRMHRGPAHPRISPALTRECMTITPPSKQFSGPSQGGSLPALFVFPAPSTLPKRPCRTPLPPQS